MYLFKKILYALFFLSASNIVSFSIAANGPWQSLPLTTQIQHDEGMLGGEGYQKVISIVYSASNPDIVYFSTDTAQVWKSVDGGYHWKASGDGFSANGARSLFVSPVNANLVLAAGFLGRERERVGKHLKPLQGIFRSTDGAKTWKLVHKGEFYKQDSTGSLFVADSRTIKNKNLNIYVGDYSSGLLVSLDGGINWEQAGFNKGHIIDMEELPANPGALYIATNQGLYYFKDGKYKKIGKGLPHSPLSIAVTPDAPQRVYVVTHHDGVFVSNDMGETFQESSDGLPVMGASYSDLAISPVDQNILYLGTHKGRRKGPFYSHNGGQRWHKSASTNAKNLTGSGGFYFSSPFSPHPVKPLVALSSSNGQARILRTENGGKTWFYSGSGYTGARIRDVVFKNNGEILLSLTDHGLWESTNNKTVFYHMPVTASNGRSSATVAVSGKKLVASIGGWKEKKLIISEDNGKTWRKHNEVKGRLSFIAFHSQNKQVIYAGAYRSDNGGRSWKQLKYEIKAMSSLNGNILYSVDPKKLNLLMSKNRGQTWSVISHFKKKILIYDMAIDSSDDKKVFIASSNGIYIFDGKNMLYRGEEHGLKKDAHGLNQVKSIAVDPRDADIIYAGKWAPGKGLSNGIFQSNDNGLSWEPYNYNLGSNFNVWSISVNPFNGSVYAGTTYGLQKLNPKDIVKDMVNE